MAKHSNATGTAAQQARENYQGRHAAGGTARDTGYVGTHRVRDGRETQR